MKKNVVLTLLSFLALTLASCQISSNNSPKRKKSSLTSSLTTLTSSSVSDDEEEEHEDHYDPGEIDPDDPEDPVDPDDPSDPDDPVDPDDPTDPDEPVDPDDPTDPDDPVDPDPVDSDPDDPVDPVDPDPVDPDPDPVDPDPVDPENPDEDEAITQYYAGISSTATGKDLKTALHNLIKVTKTYVTYNGLYDVYRKADVRPGGQYLWDIYSDSTKYTLYDSRISGNYSKEGDALNREHIIPQSHFSENLPMKADPHHVLPSDGFVNGKRSNYPHGIVSGSPTYTSNDGCKLGYGTGNTTVFEPMDHYKGDIARIYFYFVTCYQDKLSGFKDGFDAFTKNTYPSIDSDFLEVYLKWHLEDPVSDKEVVRNREIQEFQPNRNPFIDRPQYACKIWGGTNSATKALCGMQKNLCLFNF